MTTTDTSRDAFAAVRPHRPVRVQWQHLTPFATHVALAVHKQWDGFRRGVVGLFGGVPQDVYERSWRARSMAEDEILWLNVALDQRNLQVMRLQDQLDALAFAA